MAKPTKATRIFWDIATRAREAGVSVDCDSAYSTVCISAPGEEDIFMQGDNADQFISEVDALCKRYPSLSRDIAELAIAEPYSVLWS